jgi:hypothetical protein
MSRKMTSTSFFFGIDKSLCFALMVFRFGHQNSKNTRVVYRGWYFGWYWLVFRWYHTNQYQRKTRLVDFGITNLAGAYYGGSG